MFKKILVLWDKISPAQVVYAHCDIPCGIYDPHHAQLAALTVIRMTDLIADLEKTHNSHDAEFHNSMVRCVMIKEEHAELVKKEVRVIWGDYFKAEHVYKYPELVGLVQEIFKLASTARQSVKRENAEKLLEQVNRFAEIFWETKNITTFKTKAPYKPEMEVVYPKLN